MFQSHTATNFRLHVTLNGKNFITGLLDNNEHHRVDLGSHNGTHLRTLIVNLLIEYTHAGATKESYCRQYRRAKCHKDRNT